MSEYFDRYDGHPPAFVSKSLIMTIQQALVWAQTGQQLVAIGIATVTNISTWIKSLHPNLSEADLNAILDSISAGALRHKKLADLDSQP